MAKTTLKKVEDGCQNSEEGNIESSVQEDCRQKVLDRKKASSEAKPCQESR
jgi:hypothetical protein